MKKISILLFLLSLSLGSFSQGIVQKYYSDLEDRENVTSVFVSEAMFEMVVKLDIETEDSEFNELKEFINSVESFSLIKVPGLENPKNYYREGIAKLQATHDELIRVKDEDSRISVYIDEQNDVIYEVAVIGIVEGDFLAASLVGNMDLDKITKFINQANGDTFEGLSILKDVGATSMKVYPNPSAAGTVINVDVPSNLIGGKAMIYDLDGKLLKTVNADKSTLTVTTDELPSGSYIVELAKENISLKQKMIILN